MIALLNRKRPSPIGVDIGRRSVKLVQLSADQSQVVASRWAFGSEGSAEANEVADALRHAHAAGAFRGRQVALCLSNEDLVLQNIRVTKTDEDLDRRLVREAVERLSLPAAETELRFLHTGEVRQSDAVMREVIVMACLRERIDQRLALVEEAGFTPVGLEVEPVALARSAARQQRRGEEQTDRVLAVHIGYSRTIVVVVQDGEIQFVKYVDIGGREIDKAVAEHLHLQVNDAASLRRHDGNQQRRRDDEAAGSDLTVSIQRASRPIFERLAQELIKCVRYFSVTFRGAPLDRICLGGGEATESLQQWFSERLNMRCELSDSLRGIRHAQQQDRAGNWDIAMGLALRESR